jgi:integrase/recombinase XerD
VDLLHLPVTVEGSDVLRRAVAGYLARYKGLSRAHTESDLRVFLRWCTQRGLDPLAELRPLVELYVRWMQEVRRFNVPSESPTLGLTHLQFEAILTAARESANPNDFALVAMLGLLGLRIFEATGADIIDLGKETRSPRPEGARQGRPDRSRLAVARGRTSFGPGRR